MQHYTYLLVDFFSMLVPLIFSFHKRIKFYKVWKQFIPVMLVIAAFFIAWDIFYTYKNVWSFNKNYVIGIYFFNLPIEEVLFFLCIPFACTFSYYAIITQRKIAVNSNEKITSNLGFACLLFGLLNSTKLYTAATFIVLGICLLCIATFFKKFNAFRFVIIYSILLFPFFIVNGILTGSFFNRTIVSYDDTQNLGIRLLTIPVEDIFYGMALVLMNIVGMEFLLTIKKDK